MALTERSFFFHEQLILVKRFLRSERPTVQFRLGISEFFTTRYTTMFAAPKSAWHTPTSSCNSTVPYLERPKIFCCTRNSGLSMELKGSSSWSQNPAISYNHQLNPVFIFTSCLSEIRHKTFLPRVLMYFLYFQELNDLYSSPNIVRVIKSRRMRWAGRVARMEEGRGVHKV